MHIARRFTTAGRDPYASVPSRNATSEIRNPDGSVVFQADGIEVPAEWSQVACDILAQKYFRKAGVPARLAAGEEDGGPGGGGAAPRRCRRSGGIAGERTLRRRDQCPPAVRSDGQDLGLLGLE